jgi:hypothetical protein
VELLGEVASSSIPAGSCAAGISMWVGRFCILLVEGVFVERGIYISGCDSSSSASECVGCGRRVACMYGDRECVIEWVWKVNVRGVAPCRGCR